MSALLRSILVTALLLVGCSETPGTQTTIVVTAAPEIAAMAPYLHVEVRPIEGGALGAAEVEGHAWTRFASHSLAVRPRDNDASRRFFVTVYGLSQAISPFAVSESTFSGDGVQVIAIGRAVGTFQEGLHRALVIELDNSCADAACSGFAPVSDDRSAGDAPACFGADPCAANRVSPPALIPIDEVGTMRSDAGVDAGSDSGTDAETDVGSDTGSDVGSDSGSDVGSDTGSDTGAGCDGSEVGTVCGTCGGGTTQCVDGELTCEGATPPNACGGCELLVGAIGDACGEGCGAGALACDGSDSLACELAAEEITSLGLVQTSSVYNGRPEFAGSQLVDGDLSTSWLSEGDADVAPSITFSMSDARCVSRVELIGNGGNSDIEMRSFGYESAEVFFREGGADVHLTGVIGLPNTGPSESDQTLEVDLSVVGAGGAEVDTIEFRLGDSDEAETGGFSELRVWGQR